MFIKYLLLHLYNNNNKTYKIMKTNYELLNTKDYLKNGDAVLIKDKDQTICRFIFSDYESDEDCINSAKGMLNFLNIARNITQ